ncbi:linoleate 13S-lipoxygenase 3-1, chloroplastic-like protein, partial [Tanacetum coccineum]
MALAKEIMGTSILQEKQSFINSKALKPMHHHNHVSISQKEDCLRRTLSNRLTLFADQLIGWNIVLELFSLDIHTKTKAPKKSKEAVLKDWSQKANLKSEKVNYTSDILVESDFVSLWKRLRLLKSSQKEFYLKSITTIERICIFWSREIKSQKDLRREKTTKGNNPTKETEEDQEAVQGLRKREYGSEREWVNNYKETYDGHGVDSKERVEGIALVEGGGGSEICRRSRRECEMWVQIYGKVVRFAYDQSWEARAGSIGNLWIRLPVAKIERNSLGNFCGLEAENKGRKSAANKGYKEKQRSCTSDILVESDFGVPGAITITNKHQKEFYLESITIEGFACGPVYFPCNSWVQSVNDHPEPRIFFSNQPYLSDQTPAGIKLHREKELRDLRGDGTGVRK